MSTSVTEESSGWGPKTIIALIGITPMLMVLIPWDFGAAMNPYRGFMRGSSFSITIVEALVILFAIRKGYSPVLSLLSLPPICKLGFLLFWIAAIWTAVTVAMQPVGAMFGLTQIFIHLMLYLAMIDQLTSWTLKERDQIWLALGFGVLGYCLLWGVNIAFYRPVGNDWVWFVPAVTNIRWVGFFALASFAAGVGMLAIEPTSGLNRRRNLIALIFCTIGLTMAFWSGSRGAVVAIFTAAIFSFVVTLRQLQLVLLSLLATVLALTISMSLPVVHPEYGVDRIIGVSNSSNGIAGLSSGRITTWQATIEKIRQRPLAGWGIDQFRFSGPEATLGFRHPHQGLLQLLFSSGFIGLLAMLAIVWPFVMRKSYKFSYPYQWAAVGYVSGGLAYGIYDGFFYYPFAVMIFLLAIALIAIPKLPQLATDKSS